MASAWLRSGVLVGLAIAAKLFLWPLLFWLLGTRRYRAFGAAVAAAGLAILVPWSFIGFDGLTNYPELLRTAEDFYGIHGYSVTTMLSALGVGTHVASWFTIAGGVAIAVAAFVMGRKGLDEAAISLAILAALLGWPILWEYYYALLLIPLAIVRPRFSWLWLILPLFYFTHRLPRPRLLSTEIEPGGSACCVPDGVPLSSWVFNHAPAGLWPALGHAALAAGVVCVAFAAFARRRLSAEWCSWERYGGTTDRRGACDPTDLEWSCALRPDVPSADQLDGRMCEARRLERVMVQNNYANVLFLQHSHETVAAR